MRYSFDTTGTCTRRIEFDINGNVITNVTFYGGCPGNLAAISRVVDGKTVAFRNMQSCTQCLGAPFPIRFSDTVRPLHTVDPAKSSDVLQHFFPVRVNIPADLLFIHKFPPPYFFCYNPFYRQAGPSHPGRFRDRKASPAYIIFILCASYWLHA